ncbi:MAG: hypothetical protein JWR61_5872 [Ferruginibacter sp.]|uniref:hypothetical protein n=1 Tax=Ferruginibacter sp. TaxID=1940288 RepID=UPI0026583130|nr:hypothetical protein [Ferruginibacter sp.]MDB5280917.1 hypothetical protein [Ferruginibacter sp.]
MSDIDTGGASAPADSAPVSAPEAEIVNPPAPVSAEPMAKEPEPAKPEPTSRDALKRAAEKVEADEKAKPEAKPAEKPAAKVDDKAPAKVDPKADKPKEDAPARDETGKFASKTPAEAEKPAADAPKADAATEQASKDAAPHHEPPARFTAEAKAAWKDAPEHVRTETHRAITELTQGIEKHREAAKEYEPIKEYGELAKQQRTNLKAALDNYVGIERLLRQDDVAGIEQICQNLGKDPREIAAKILGRTPEQHTEAIGAQMRELNAKADHHYKIANQLHSENASLKEVVASYQTKEIESFKSQNDRFEDLLPEMVKLINSGMANDLPEAYRKASILNPSAEKPQSNPAPETPAKVLSDPAAQTLKGSKSITGSPSNGSTPPQRPPSSSIKDSLKRAIAQAG